MDLRHRIGEDMHCDWCGIGYPHHKLFPCAGGWRTEAINGKEKSVRIPGDEAEIAANRAAHPYIREPLVIDREAAKRIGLAVIAQTMADIVMPSPCFGDDDCSPTAARNRARRIDEIKRLRAEAWAFLFSASGRDLCEMLGLDPDAVRDRAFELRPDGPRPDSDEHPRVLGVADGNP